MTTAWAIVVGVAATVAASITVSAIIDRDAREALVRVLAAAFLGPALALTFLIDRGAPARRLSGEAMARFAAAENVDGGTPAWVFTIAPRAGIVLFRRNGIGDLRLGRRRLRSAPRVLSTAESNLLRQLCERYGDEVGRLVFGRGEDFARRALAEQVTT